jgi:hypothetical protein
MSTPQAEDGFASLRELASLKFDGDGLHYFSRANAEMLARLLHEHEECEVANARLLRERDDWQKLAIELGANGKATRDLHRNDLTLSMRVDAGLLRLGKVDVLTASFQRMRDQYDAWLELDAAAARATPAPGDTA